jgi:hypothetical protein
MDQQRDARERLGGIEGTDDASLGVGPPPPEAPPAAAIDEDEAPVPGATFDDHRPTEAKPWSTTLAAQSSQAGVGNDPADSHYHEDLDPDDEHR